MFRDVIKKEISKLVPAGTVFSVGASEQEEHGDYSSNIALVLAQKEGKNPRDVAEEIKKNMVPRLCSIENVLDKSGQSAPLERIEIAGPGFLNFFILRNVLLDRLAAIQKKGVVNQYVTKIGSKKRASVEFISANPTGPLHIGNARGGPLGDVVANVLEAVGYKVTREYYHNDAGAQVAKYANSLWHWYLVACGERSVFPEGGYEGAYAQEWGKRAYKKWGRKLISDQRGKNVLTQFAIEKLMKENLAAIEKMGIVFNRITHESNLAKTKTNTALELLRKKGFIQKKEGAEWFSSPDGVEGVVVKSDGTPIYFANDIAYHKEKFSRSDVTIDVLGEGHEGHIPKLRAVARALGVPDDNFVVVVHGQVTLLRNGVVMSMSKRKGNFVTAQEVLDEVGRDAFRYFLLQYAPRSPIVFDLDLAKERSKKNPVYYVQYAHARACSILRKIHRKSDFHGKSDFRKLLISREELSLIKKILQLPEIVEDIALDYQVQRLPKYTYELAQTFTNFYENCRVIDGENQELTKARLGLTQAAQKTLATALSLMGIAAPKKM